MLVSKLEIGNHHGDLNNTNYNIKCVVIIFLFLFVNSPVSLIYRMRITIITRDIIKIFNFLF